MTTLRFVDYFAGIGGFTLGAQLAGHRTVMAINHAPVAVEYHQRNHPDVLHACEDLCRYNPRKLLPHDGLLAGPSCQGHSNARGVAAGSEADAAWDDTRATAWAVTDAIEIRKPKVVVVENVLGFRRWPLFDLWFQAFARLGYGARLHLLDAADFGVPQNRPRVVITAVLDGEPGAIVPTTTVHRPIREVLDFEDGVWSLTHKKGRSPKTIARVERGRKDVGRTFVMPYNGKGSGLTGRSIDRPIATITAADRWALVDGDRMRMLTIRELQAAMGFPAHYVLPPKREDATRCLGNAICPAMAKAAIESVARVA